MKRLFNVFQEIIKIGLFFVLSYIWLSYYLQDDLFSIVLSISISVLLEILSLITSRKKQAQTLLKSKQKTDAENMFFSLVTDKNSLNFFYNMFSTRHKNIKKENDYLIITNQENEQMIFCPFMNIRQLEIDDVIAIAKTHHDAKKIVVVCNEISPNCNKYKSPFNCEMVLLNKFDTYLSLYCEYEYFPNTTNSPAVFPKKHLKDVLHTIFNKTKAKSYIFSGGILLLSSLYIPYNTYYKIIASILFIFAIICFFVDKQSNKKQLV